LRLVLAGGGLFVIIIVLLAVLGGSKRQPAAPRTHTPTHARATVPPPARTTTRARSTKPVHRPARPAPASAGPGAGHDILLIAGFAPGRAWSTAIGATPTAVFVVDPDDGPGAHANAALRREVSAARRAGGLPVGFVATGRGRGSVHAAETELAHYRSWYGVSDVFLAGAATKAGALGYYRAVAAVARSHGAKLVVVDPGRVPARGYFDVANVVVTFAGHYRHYLNASVPGWLAHIAADRKANLVTDAPTQGDARHALAIAHRRGVGIAYVTSAAGRHAFASLPSYLRHERSWLTASAPSH
jgi:hypothetical protein